MNTQPIYHTNMSQLLKPSNKVPLNPATGRPYRQIKAKFTRSGDYITTRTGARGLVLATVDLGVVTKITLRVVDRMGNRKSEEFFIPNTERVTRSKVR